ncbi:phage portal protein [Roseococcus sp. SDR]|uniref:phage portal protein n=1 Tax=Roseococcus sp. SDR TaxID=2835532 RepID=UPI001BCEAD26|nr:phage portal protein [Roseococcus sp. SDR]MBS7792174.1 phage portal protein [Roseococcus sp. SDR]MBV1847488.1 phage portal protein [Roseococcus sp. SDR]
MGRLRDAWRVLTAPQAGHGGGRRAFLGAAPSRLLEDLPSGAAAAPNREIRQALKVLRARSRHLAQNDGFSKGFLKTLRRNVIGASGFVLQMQVQMERGGRPDEDANRRIEAAWQEWAKVGSCDVTGKLSFADVCRSVIGQVARDGEALVRIVRGSRFNRFGLALQILDVALLDEDLMCAQGAIGGWRLPAGHTVRSGVERDEFGRPVAYHLRTTLEGDDCYTAGGRRYQRLPADDIRHLFLSEWADQVRGVPWLDTAIRALAMLDGYSEAELAAARVSAGKMGFYRIDSDEEPDGELAADGRLVQKAEAGTFELLPKGVDFQSFDPQHPTQAFADFVGAILRSAASGSGLSYPAFANDAAKLSYSALRGVTLEDREEYRTLQAWMIGSLCEPIFAPWLREALITGALSLPPGKFDRFNRPSFTARGWQWVDPLKEVNAMREAVGLGIAARTDLVAERGGDFADTVAKLRAEQAMMEGLGQPAAPSSTFNIIDQGS